VNRSHSCVIPEHLHVIIFVKQNLRYNSIIMTATTATIIDDEGRCASHPIVQLCRRSHRTGEWKMLMNSCPLCFVDGIKKQGSVIPKQCEQDKDEGEPLVFDGTAPAVEAKARQKSLPLPHRSPPPPPPPLARRRSHSTSSRRGSRVRFQPDKDVIFTPTTPMPTGKSVLRASPKYKVCEEMMQQQLDDSDRVTTMSMDLCIDIDDEESKSSVVRAHEENRMTDLQDKEEKGVGNEKKYPGLKMQPPPSLFLCANENDDISSSTTKQDDPQDDAFGGGMLDEVDDQDGRRSHYQVEHVGRPDPEESPAECRASRQNRRSQRSLSSQHQRSSSQQRRECVRELGGGRQHESSPSPLCFSPVDQEEQHSSSALTPIMMQSLQPSVIRQHHDRKNYCQQVGPLYAQIVVRPDDDEVSALSFSGRSVRSCPDRSFPPICEDTSQEYEHNSSSSGAKNADNAIAYTTATSLSKMMKNTGDYDLKTGRCVHHPHIRLRKKKLFGKGWTVMMSACPDCCIDELYKMKLALIKENTTNGTSRERPLDASYHSEGGTLTPRISISLCRSSTDCRGSASVLSNPKAKSKVSPSSSTKMVPVTTLPRSSTRDNHRGPPPVLKKCKSHNDSDELTASSSGASSNQGGYDHSRSRKNQHSISIGA
jgi:hypothetical protein